MRRERQMEGIAAEQGASFRVIADAVGYSTATVQQIVKANVASPNLTMELAP